MKKDFAVEELKKPSIPKKWTYAESVKKVKGFTYKWKHLTIEIAKELWVAREKLSKRTGRPRITKKVVKKLTTYKTHSWTDYCKEIGSSRQSVDVWLARFFGSLKKPTQKIEALPGVDHVLEYFKCIVKNYSGKERKPFVGCEGNCPMLGTCKEFAKTATERLTEKSKEKEKRG